MNKIHQEYNILDLQSLKKDLSHCIQYKIQELNEELFYVRFMKEKGCRSENIFAIIFYNGILFVIIGILIQMIYQQWIDWEDLEKIQGTECPYGFVYILIAVPILLIQGYDYDSENKNEKELTLLLEDLDYFTGLSQNQQQRQQKIFVKHKIFKFEIIKFFINPLLLMIVFFSDGFYSAINQFVVFTFISQLQRGVLYKMEQMAIATTENDSLEWYFDLNSEKDEYYNQDEQLQIFNSALQKLKILCNKEIYEKGNQHSFIFKRLLVKFFYIKIVITVTYALLYSFSIHNFWISQNQKDYSQQIYEKVVYIIGFYLNPDNDFIEVQELNKFKIYLKYLKYSAIKHKFVKFNDIEIDENLSIIGDLYAQKQSMKIFSFLLILFTFQFQEIFDFIINLYSLEYILNLDKGLIDEMYNWFSRERIRKLAQLSIFQYPQIIKYKTVDQYYCYYLELKINEDDFKENDIHNDDLSSIIMKELNEIYDQLFFEDGFQLLYLEPQRCKIIRWLVFLIIKFCYCSLMLLDKIQKWYDLRDEDVYINGQFPWGIVYICISLVIIVSQGIGTSGENQLFKKYFLLRKHFIEINNNQQPKFQWNDKILSDLKWFKEVQSYFLLAILVTLIFFQQFYYEVILNILQLEFLSTLDDHVIGNYFRYRYRYKNLQQHWTKLDRIEKIKHQTLENIYRYVWGLKQIDHPVKQKSAELNLQQDEQNGLLTQQIPQGKNPMIQICQEKQKKNINLQSEQNEQENIPIIMKDDQHQQQFQEEDIPIIDYYDEGEILSRDLKIIWRIIIQTKEEELPLEIASILIKSIMQYPNFRRNYEFINKQFKPITLVFALN